MTVFVDAKTNRECGSCTLCCTLLPVRELEKKGGQKCRHQSSKGCAIHDKANPAARLLASLGKGPPVPSMPPSCRIWSCQWRRGDDTGRRPDRVGLVVDCMPDFIIATHDATGETTKVPVLQVWLDPARPDAHKDPAFRRYLAAAYAAGGFVGLIRLSPTEAFLLVPPEADEGGDWHEHRGNSMMAGTHTAEEIAEAINAEVVHRPME